MDTYSVIRISNIDAKHVWRTTFARHHYLSDRVTPHHAWILADEDDILIGFTSSMALPGYKGYAVLTPQREHRTVIIPDYQGIGLGVRLSNWQGWYWQSIGVRFFSKTSHPRMGAYRDNSPLWRPTSSNHRSQGSNGGTKSWSVKHRPAYSHEFIGNVDAYKLLSRPATLDTLNS